MEKKLHKSDTDKKLGGVCAGIAETLDIDISVVRIAAFFLCVIYPVMLIVYFLLAIFLPSKTNSNEVSVQSNESIPPQITPEGRSSFALWAFISTVFCASLGYAVCKKCGLAANIDSVILFAVLAAGLYIFFSGLCEPSQNRNHKITKISIGAVISVMCISRALDKFSLTFLPFNYLTLSAFYFWPLLMVAFGLTVIISNKKIATAVWVTIFVLLVIFSVVSRLFTAINFY